MKIINEYMLFLSLVDLATLSIEVNLIASYKQFAGAFGILYFDYQGTH